MRVFFDTISSFFTGSHEFLTSGGDEPFFLIQFSMKPLVFLSLGYPLPMSIPNLSETRSRRSYNKYVIQYEPLYLPADAAIQSGVLLETSFAEISFPVVTMDVHRERTLCDLLRPRNHTDIQIVATAFKQSEKNIPAQLVLQNYLLT